MQKGDARQIWCGGGGRLPVLSLPFQFGWETALVISNQSVKDLLAEKSLSVCLHGQYVSNLIKEAGIKT